MPDGQRVEELFEKIEQAMYRKEISDSGGRFAASVQEFYEKNDFIIDAQFAKLEELLDGN